MGGVKNREAKKKANHVVSSGSGGGTKGPSVIDKRGQEIKCMYCDKVYKESGKLKHHIATKHADQLPLGTVEKEELQPSTPAAPVRPGKQSPDPASSSVAAATTSKPQTQQSHHHHHHHHQQQQQQQRQQLTQQQQGEPQQAAGAGDAGGMMDVGSKAGYYTSKSPKLHLLEWAQRSGFERPKYKVNKQEEDGTVTCRVFINHPKRKEEEVVAFLDRKYAAEDPQEAEQRTALTALEKVAGSCNYHMLLPKQYLQLWKELGQATVERKEREAARAAEVERQQQREKAREVKEAHFAPQKVVMSKEIQAALQVLVQERYALRAQMAAVGGAMGPGSSASLSSSDGSHICSTAGASSLGGSCVSGSTTGGGAGGHGPAAALPPLPTAVPNHSALCAELAKMGFTSTQVQMAMEYAARVAHQWAATKEGLLEWLLVHVPTDQLPPKCALTQQWLGGLLARAH